MTEEKVKETLDLSKLDITVDDQAIFDNLMHLSPEERKEKMKEIHLESKFSDEQIKQLKS